MHAPPLHNEQAERAVLGSIMDDSEAVLPIALRRNLDRTAFYLPAHGEIWQAIIALNDDGKAVDLTTVSTYLKSVGQLERVGGHLWLCKLLDNVIGANCEHYLDDLCKLWMGRRILTSNHTANELIMNGDNPREVLIDHIVALNEIAGSEREGESKRDAWIEVRETSERAREGKLIGMPSPWATFNEATGGALYGDFTLAIGRSGTGKSFMAHQWGLHAGVQANFAVPGVYYPLEDGVKMATLRATCMLAGVNPSDYMRGRFTDDDRAAMDGAATRLIDSGYEIREGNRKTLPQLKMDIAHGVGKHGFRFAILDAFKDLGETEEGLKAQVKAAKWAQNTAREFNIALIVVQHITPSKIIRRKSAKEKWWERLTIDDSRGASQITDSARKILALDCQWRDDGYEGYALKCVKNNYGRTGAVALDVDPVTRAFTENLTREPYEDWIDDRGKPLKKKTGWRDHKPVVAEEFDPDMEPGL